jgi:hypothetical protein
MKSKLLLKFPLLLAATSLCGRLQAHEHLAAGAGTNNLGAPILEFVNAGDYNTDSGYVFNLDSGTTNDAYLGNYYTGDQVFAALAATPDNGGPEFGAAALGTYIQIKLLSIEGPAGASFGFWETQEDGFDSTNLTWSLPVPYANGTNLIFVSQSDGSPGSDPYGHLHGRIYSFTKPGLYKATWQFVDTSTNGVNGAPLNLPSEPFSIYYQADLTIAGMSMDTNTASLTFAAASDVPDEDPDAPPTSYTPETATSLDPDAEWESLDGYTVMGDDHLHTVSVPASNTAAFYRLRADGSN